MAAGDAEIPLGSRAPDFSLQPTDGRTYALKDVAGEKGAVIVFICNHCPYVKAVIGRLVADARALLREGVGIAAICSNDAENYPEDSFPRMREFAKRHDFPFPYLHDETQAIARAYGAVCTPDFFGFDRGRGRGRATFVEAAAISEPEVAARAGSFSKPCAPSPPAALPRRIKFPRSAARSNGRPGRGDIRSPNDLIAPLKRQHFPDGGAEECGRRRK